MHPSTPKTYTCFACSSNRNSFGLQQGFFVAETPDDQDRYPVLRTHTSGTFRPLDQGVLRDDGLFCHGHNLCEMTDEVDRVTPAKRTKFLEAARTALEKSRARTQPTTRT